MKKKITFSILIAHVFFTSNGMNILQTKPVSNAIADRTSAAQEFKVWLVNQPPLETMDLFTLLKGLPAIGFYGQGYPFCTRYALIRLNPSTILQVLPTTMINALPTSIRNALSAPFNQTNGTTGGKIILAQIMINGNTSNQQNPNMVFHAFGALWHQQPYWSENIPMGIFASDGIRQIDIPFNAFGTLSVNPHNGGGPALSPDNARIQLEQQRTIATFWSAAYSNNEQYVTITFHILANGKTTSDKLEVACILADTLEQFLKNLSTLGSSLPAADKTALHNAVATIYALLQVKRPTSLEEQFQLLNQQLIAFANALPQQPTIKKDQNNVPPKKLPPTQMDILQQNPLFQKMKEKANK